MYEELQAVNQLLTPESILTFGRIGGGLGIFIWSMMWLLKRGDKLQKENISELRDQRDSYKTRAEKAEEELARIRGLVQDEDDETQENPHPGPGGPEWG